MIPDNLISAKVERLLEMPAEIAEASMNWGYLNRDEKRVLARLRLEAKREGFKTVQEREDYALLHSEYDVFLEGLKIAQYEFSKLTHERDAIETLVRAWQTESSNRRAMDHV